MNRFSDCFSRPSGLLQQPKNETEKLFVNSVMTLFGVNDVMALEK